MPLNIIRMQIILELFMKNHVTLKTRVMASKNDKITYNLKYTKIENFFLIVIFFNFFVIFILLLKNAALVSISDLFKKIERQNISIIPNFWTLMFVGLCVDEKNGLCGFIKLVFLHMLFVVVTVLVFIVCFWLFPTV